MTLFSETKTPSWGEVVERIKGLQRGQRVELARLVGVDKSLVSMWVSGARGDPKVSVYFKTLRALDDLERN